MPFTAADLTCFRLAAESVFQDTCVILTRLAGAVDDYGMPTETWQEHDEIACGLDQRSSREVYNAEAAFFDARVRLPADTDVTRVDRVRITHRFGEELETPIVYVTTGDPITGPSAITINLRNLVVAP